MLIERTYLESSSKKMNDDIRASQFIYSLNLPLLLIASIFSSSQIFLDNRNVQRDPKKVLIIFFLNKNRNKRKKSPKEFLIKNLLKHPRPEITESQTFAKNVFALNEKEEFSTFA